MSTTTTGEKIRLLRKQAGLTQTELGERLGVRTNAVSKWECGRVEDIPMSKIKAMAVLFSVPISYLIDADNDAEVSSRNETMVPSKSTLQAAFWGGDKDLSQEDMDAMWSDVERFAAFLAEQKKREKGDSDK